MTDFLETAVVTGGSRGIGQSLVKRLAADGWQVYFTYVHNADKAELVRREVEEQGGRARAFQLDVSNTEDVSAWFREEIKGSVNLGALVNNAGITRDGLLLRMKDSDWEDVLQVNLNGPFACLREAAKIMVRRRQGRIINITSVAGQSGNPGQANYCASKAGLIGLTKTAAAELAPRGITVNAVAPGLITTEMTGYLGEQAQESYLSRIPLGRFGESNEVAAAVSWLASEEAGYVTGHVLSLNGGMYM